TLGSRTWSKHRGSNSRRDGRDPRSARHCLRPETSPSRSGLERARRRPRRSLRSAEDRRAEGTHGCREEAVPGIVESVAVQTAEWLKLTETKLVSREGRELREWDCNWCH